MNQLLHFLRVTNYSRAGVIKMFGIRGKMVAAKQRISQILEISCMLEDEDHDDSVISMFQHVPYKQVKQARLEVELKIAEAHASCWRHKNRMI